jgi:hypothetical protein
LSNLTLNCQEQLKNYLIGLPAGKQAVLVAFVLMAADPTVSTLLVSHINARLVTSELTPAVLKETTPP